MSDNHINESEIPESSQYIAESTLIPATDLQIPGTDQVSHDMGDEYASQSLADENVVRAVEKKKFDVKKNFPIIAVGVVGAILLGLIGTKMLGKQGGISARPQQAIQSPQPSAQDSMLLNAQTPMQLPAPAENEPAQAVPAPAENEPVGAPALAIAPQAVVQAAAAHTAAQEHAHAPSAQAPASQGAHDHSHDDVLQLKARISAQESQIRALDERVARLEALVAQMQKTIQAQAQQRPTVNAQGAAVGAVRAPEKKRSDEGSSAGAAAAKAPIKAVVTELSAEAAQKAREAREARQAELRAKAIAEARAKAKLQAEEQRAEAEEIRREEQRLKAEREASAERVARGFTVAAVKDNLAWLRDSSGRIHSFTLGDEVPGLGRLSIIDEVDHSVKAGNRTIR